MGDTAVTSVAEPLTMSELSIREVASSMKNLRKCNTMSVLQSKTQIFYGIRASVSRTCLKLMHTPNTLLGNIEK